VKIFNVDGELINKWELGEEYHHSLPIPLLAVQCDLVFLFEPRSFLVRVFNRDGTELTTFGKGNGTGQPEGLCVNDRGLVFVGEGRGQYGEPVRELACVFVFSFPGGPP